MTQPMIGIVGGALLTLLLTGCAEMPTPTAAWSPQATSYVPRYYYAPPMIESTPPDNGALQDMLPAPAPIVPREFRPSPGTNASNEAGQSDGTSPAASTPEPSSASSDCVGWWRLCHLWE